MGVKLSATAIVLFFGAAFPAHANYNLNCAINGLQGLAKVSSSNEPVLQCNAHCEFVTAFNKVFVGEQNFTLFPGENGVKFTVSADATITTARNARINCKPQQ